MKLFYKPGSCSLASHIVFRESGLDFSIEQVDLVTKQTEHGENFLHINPKGQVPTLLLDDGSILTEGVAIMQYLADQVPDRKLISPTGSMARYHAIEGLNYVATELHKSFGAFFAPNIPVEYQDLVRHKLNNQFQYLNGVFETQQFFCGSIFSVVDAYLYVVLRWAEVKKFDLNSLPSLSKYVKDIGSRPSVIAALKAEGLA